MCACVPEEKNHINYSRPVTQISTNYTTYALKYTNVYSINMNIQRVLRSNKINWKFETWQMFHTEADTVNKIYFTVHVLRFYNVSVTAED